jgi:dTDP-4-dehydrorhamnose reductase
VPATSDCDWKSDEFKETSAISEPIKANAFIWPFGTEVMPIEAKGEGPTLQGPVLILGGESTIARHLSRHLTSMGIRVISTSRRANRGGQANTCLFDLASPDAPLPLDEADCVVVCAGVTNILECERNRPLSDLINVENTVRVIDRCLENERRILYFSSNAVFDGSAPFCRLDQPPNPKSRYGHQKLLIERYLTEKAAHSSIIVRLTKVFSEEMPLLATWRRQVAAGEPVKAFSNVLVSPVYIRDVAMCVEGLLSGSAAGIFQLGGEQEFSYLDLARRYFANDPEAATLVRSGSREDGLPIYNHFNSLKTELPSKLLGDLKNKQGTDNDFRSW